MDSGCRIQDAGCKPVCTFSSGRARSSVLGIRPSASTRYRVSGPRCRVPGPHPRSSALGIRPSAVEGWGKGDGTFPYPSSRPGAENRRPETEYGTGYPTPGTQYLIALLPYCPTAPLPYCLTALLPYCPTALLPYCLIALLPSCPSALSCIYQGSPKTFPMTTRSRGWMSKLKRTICCHVPRSSRPFVMGTVREGPMTVARTWLRPLPSFQVR
jgi:hypothetical protein